MAISQIDIATPAAQNIFTDTNIGAGVDGIKSSSAKVLFLSIDNSANAAASYIKLYNVASGSVTVGTTVPDQVLYAPASTVVTHVYYSGANPGVTFGTALSAAATTAGGTAGSTPPVDSVILTVSYI